MTQKISNKLQSKLKKIKMLVLDVDGILTSGKIFWLKDQSWTREFHVHDGYGIKLLLDHGFQVGIITAGDNLDMLERLNFLGIKNIFSGKEDKFSQYKKLLEKTQLNDDEILYMGDELLDIPVLEKVGFSATVCDALPTVKKRVDFVTKLSGGTGAVREVIEMLRKVQKIGPYID